MKDINHSVEVGLRCLRQDLGQGTLDNGVGAQDAATHVLQATDRFQSLLPIMDYDPSHSPARHQEALGQTAAGQDRYLGGQAAHSQVLGAREHKVLIDLVGW